MINRIIELDKEVFLALNRQHTEALDPVMYFLTHTLAWLPLFALILYGVVKVFGRNSWIFLVGIALTVFMADQLTSSVMKPYFARLRPSHEPALAGMVHSVNNYLGGKYGFASSHAANTFGVALFIFLLLRKHFRAVTLLFIWALFVAYTRIYLGVHYPGDLIAGALVGMFFGWILYVITMKVYVRFAGPAGNA